MSFTTLYHRLLPLWGPQLHFADGLMLEHKKPFLALGKLKGQQNTSAPGEHFYSESFSKSWQKAEDSVRADDALGKLLLWSMYQVFHRQAQQLFGQGVMVLSPADVPPSEVEEQFRKNLSEPGYEEEKAAFAALG